MGSLEVLRREVDRLYTSENPQRAPLANWLYTDHVYQVAEAAASVAKRFGGNPDLAYAAGALHDVADAIVPREDVAHAERSAQTARYVLGKAGFSAEEITIAVDDALRFHSCHGTDRPETLEGRALSTGDAIAHLTTNFYPHLADVKKNIHTKGEICAWLSEKIDRDFHAKIAYGEIREEVRSNYEQLKILFTI